MSEIPSKSPVSLNQWIHLGFYGLLCLSLILSLIFNTILIFLIVLILGLLMYYVLMFLDFSKSKKTLESPEMASNEKKTVYKPAINQVRTTGIIISALLIIGFLVTFALEIFYVYLIMTIVCVAVTIYLKKKWALDETAVASSKSPRYGWIDQFRGMVVIFFIIASITWILSGNGDLPPVGPTFLNHGWKYASVEGWPEMITIIDLGQQILMFIVGFVGTLSLNKRIERENLIGAFTHILRRYFALLFLAILLEGILGEESLVLTDWSIVGVFWTGTFSNLAWGSLFSFLLVLVLKNKPDIRFLIALGIMTIYSIMFAFPGLQNWQWMVNGEKFFEIPWNTINHVSIAILGTCTYDWYMIKTEENPTKGWKERILPIGSFLFILAWLVNFVEPAEHHDATTALSLLAIASSQFILFLFYNFDKIGFKVPGLDEFGKNLLIMFLFTGLWGPYLDLFTHEYLAVNPPIALVVVGVIPILLQYFAAWVFAKFKIYIKF